MRDDADQRRISKIEPNGDEFITIGEFYERRTHGGQIDHIFTITGRSGPAVQVIWSQTGSIFGLDRVLYLHTDHLGSVDTITDAKGNLGEHLKYDPFGGRVEPTRLDHPLSASTLGERRGFTGHEHDDELTLINMKGRIYDPLLGRFLTTDPIVSNPVYGQAYDRYAYVLNNPLSVTDQTGLQSDREGENWPAFSAGGGWFYYSSALQLEHAISNAGIFIQGRSTPQFSARQNAALINYADSTDSRTSGPAPVRVGSPTYYQERDKDFVRRHVGTTIQSPSYYLNYGQKYYDRFHSELRPRLSPAGQQWLDRTAVNLQQAIEKRRASDPTSFAKLEEDPQAFLDFAFLTHPDAYLAGGLNGLPFWDLVEITLTPDLTDTFFNESGREQIYGTGIYYIGIVPYLSPGAWQKQAFEIPVHR